MYLNIIIVFLLINSICIGIFKRNKISKGEEVDKIALNQDAAYEGYIYLKKKIKFIQLIKINKLIKCPLSTSKTVMEESWRIVQKWLGSSFGVRRRFYKYALF